MAVSALSYILSPTDRYVRIFTDSQATVLALHNNIISSKVVHSTIMAINSISNALRHISISWIKAHTGHPGNELADDLAKSCASFPINSFPLLPSPAIFKKLLWDNIYKEWHNEWQLHPHCRLSKNFLPKPSRQKTRSLLHLSRSQMRRLIELITGQNNLNYIQSKIDPLNTSPLCRFCEEEDETFAHLLNECPCFISYRRDILKNTPLHNTLKWKPKTLLTFSYIPSIDEALQPQQ